MNLNRLGFWRALIVAFVAFSFSTLAAVPDAPANAHASWVNNQSAVLTWDDVPEADSFTVRRYDAATEAWVVAGSELSAPMFREEPGIEPPLQYSVSAANGDGESAEAFVNADTGGYSGMTIMYYDPGSYPGRRGRTWLTLQYVASPVSGVDALLEFGTDPQNLEFVEYRANYAGSHTFTITNLTPATVYYYRVTLSDTNRLGYSVAQSSYTLPANVPPIVGALQGTMFEDGAPISLYPTYSDPDTYTPPTYRVVTGPQHGSVTFNGVKFTYTPHLNYNGTDTFTYAAHDGEDEGAPGTVTVTINPVNDAPAANNQTVFGLYNTPRSIVLTGSDIEGSSLTYFVQSAPANGTLSGTAPNLTFTPNIGWSGTTSFTFRVHDGQLNSALATVTISVQPPVAPPATALGLAAQAVSRTQINLMWVDASGNEDGFSIERLNGSIWQVVGTVGPNVQSFANTGLQPNRFYSYRIRAFNVIGSSGYSNTATAKTLP